MLSPRHNGKRSQTVPSSLQKVKMIKGEGVELEYQVFGTWGANEMMVLLVPDEGVAGISAAWAETFTGGLVQGGCTVIRYNTRDTGGSVKFTGSRPWYDCFLKRLRIRRHAPYSATSLAADISTLLWNLCIPSCHIVGFGTGGVIAKLFSVLYPSQCSTLTFIATPTPPHSLSTVKRGKPPLNLPRPSSHDPLSYKARYLAESRRKLCTAGASYGSATLSDLYYVVLKSTRGGDRCPMRVYEECSARMRWCLEAEGKHVEDLLKGIKQCSKPILIVHGSLDPVVPIAAVAEYAASLSKADLLILQGVKHDIPDTHAPVISAAILRLIHRSTTPSPHSLRTPSNPSLYEFFPSTTHPPTTSLPYTTFDA